MDESLKLIPLFLWTLIWKGLGLWRASKRDNKPVFVLFLVLNTLGAFEILYIVWLSKIDPKNVNAFLKKRTPWVFPLAKKLHIKL